MNADAPSIDVHFLDYPDKEINELGPRGIGEIGLAGICRCDHGGGCIMRPECGCASCRLG